MTPSQGRIVCFKGLEANGSDEHPAIVTHAFNPNMVNLTVFPDNGVTVEKGTDEQPNAEIKFAVGFTSVRFFQTRAEKDTYLAECAEKGNDPGVLAFPYRD